MATESSAQITDIVTSTLPGSDTPAPNTHIVTSALPAATTGTFQEASPQTILVTATAPVPVFPTVATSSLPSSSQTILVTATAPVPVFPTVATSSLPSSPSSASSVSVLSTIHPTSPTPLPSGLSASAKIGIGLGVPFGVIVLAIVAFLGYLYGKRRGNKRNTVPVADEQFRGFPGDKDPSAMRGQGGAGAVGTQESDDNGELPRYAEELQGTPGVKRHELPAQREATGYITPDVITR